MTIVAQGWMHDQSPLWVGGLKQSCLRVDALPKSPMGGRSKRKVAQEGRTTNKIT